MDSKRKITKRLFTGPVTVSHKCKIIDNLPHSTFGVTWSHRSRDYLIAHMPFPIGVPLERILYSCQFYNKIELNWILNPAVFEILRSKRIGVTSLTFQGHAASSATWPFDSPYDISYWWSFGTKPLSLTVSEICNVKCNAMVDVTLIDL